MLIPSDTGLAVIDVQARLVPAIADHDALLGNVRRLIEGARLLGNPVCATEQNPDGLGPSVPDLLPPEVPVFKKTTFDSTHVEGFADWCAARSGIVVCGMEAHVCLLQTVLGLQASKQPVFVVRDAVGSRETADRDAAIARMRGAGATIVTTEMVLFEWLGSSDHPRFKEVLRLVK
ncbi:MAG: isochorismatase family protein [Methyloligellaceae bacterium]